jgi:hypothetical protein
VLTRTRTDTLPMAFGTRGKRRRLSPKQARVCARDNKLYMYYIQFRGERAGGPGGHAAFEPKQSQLQPVESPQLRHRARYFSLGPVKRPTRAAGQVTHSAPLLQRLSQAAGLRSMIWSARINRLHSRGKHTTQNEEKIGGHAHLG